MVALSSVESVLSILYEVLIDSRDTIAQINQACSKKGLPLLCPSARMVFLPFPAIPTTALMGLG